MADRVGQQLGNYRLTRLLGEGGFAEVYLGEHVYLGTSAAIKVLAKSLTSKDLERFRAEAQIIANLKHPHIVQMLEFGVAENIPYLVMEFAPHGTLRTRHPKGTQLTLTTILPYVQQIASALQFAHDHKIIHRDLKPENLLLGAQDELLLSDFGMAVVAQSSRYQAPEELVGTAAYMAPEQIQTHPVPASDQYALGVMIYEWISGRPPFQGSISEVIAKHLFIEPPSLQQQIPGLSPAVEEVVLTALTKDPQARFANMQAFATAFGQAGREQQPTIVRPASSLPSPTAASSVTTPPVGSWQLVPTRITPPQPEESAPHVERTDSPELLLAPTLRAAAPSTVPAPALTESRTKYRWVRGLLVALVLLVLVSEGLVGLVLAGQHSPTSVGSPSNGAASPSVGSTPNGATSPSVSTTPSPAPGTIIEFAVPTGSGPFSITAGPDGNLWFTEYGTDKIGRITSGR